MHTKDKGNIAELAAAKELINKGFSISFPFGDNERYDLVVDDGSGLERAQVRKATKKDGYLVFKCYSNQRIEGEIERRSFNREEIDYFLVWCQEQKNLYKIPIEEAPKTEMRLRIEKTENSQEKNVNWASDYKIGRV